MTHIQTGASIPAIAVIGMSCWYAGASDLRQLWENILAKRCQFRRFPDQRLPLSEYYDPDPTAPDKTYGTRAAVIDGFKFDWASKRIPKTTFESTDIVHWLALEIALKALEHAEYTRGSVATERSGVVLGNTLAGEQMRSNGMRLRWPYVRRTLRAATEAKGLPLPLVDELVETMEEYFKSALQPVTEDTLAGGLSNTIAGRICNFLDFNGGGYTVDGACSSSLIAVATAATALANGDLDLALAGGVDVSLDTFEMIGFTKTGALTSKDMNVYDRKASGFIPGEGCGFVVLKRLEDARADGNYVYAVLDGWGISSDGRGGITAPGREGQAMALRRAYTRAGCSPRDLAFIEGHGTGTPVGDRTELEAIALAMSSGGEETPRTCGITSFKSLFGHTKAAAGIGGFIKSVIAVNRRVLPPTAGCKEPNEVFETSAHCLYPILHGELRSQTDTLRAGVSAMGFGGINCHVTIKSGDAPSPQLEPSIKEQALLISNQDTELFVLGASSVPALVQRTQALTRVAEGMSVGELVDLAAHLVRELEPQLTFRAAVIATTPDELIQGLKQLEKILGETPPAEGEVVSSPHKDVWLGNAVSPCRVGFLFPAQGSQQLNMARTLVERYSWARELVEQADHWLRDVGSEAVSPLIFRLPPERAVNAEQLQEWAAKLAQTEVAQPAICLASLLWTRWLERLGVKPVAVAGHSLGELTAFHVAGAFDEKALFGLAGVRGRTMAASGNDSGTMASLGCSQKTAERLLERVSGYAIVANINSPRQVVISGERSSVKEAMKLAEAEGIWTRELSVSNAFHSQLISKAAEHLHTHAPVPELLENTSVQLFSSINGQQVKPGLKLREHFAHQVLEQVDFVALVKTLAQECDLLVEVGPGRVLSGLVSEITGASGSLCLPIASKPELDRDLNTVLASLWVHGGEINWQFLYEGRLVRPFVPASELVFIENPCERPFKISGARTTHVFPVSEGWFESMLANAANVSPQVMSDYLSWRGKFLTEVVRADLQTLPSLSTTHNGVAKVQDVRVFSPGISEVPTLRETVGSPMNYKKAGAIEELLVDLVAQKTGYPPESIVLEAQLLDDLNLDSIKAGELVAAVAKEYGVAGKLDPSSLANATLQGVVEAIRHAIPDGDETIEAVTRAPKVAATIPKLLLELVEQRTGFPQNTLSMNLRLLDDLNLDSIKAAEFVAEAAKRVGVEGRLDPAKFANSTLIEVADALQQLFEEVSTIELVEQVGRSTLDTFKSAKADLTNVSKILTTQKQKRWVRNFVVQYIAEEAPAIPLEQDGEDWETANVLILCEPDETDMAEVLCSELQSRGARVQTTSFAEGRNQALTASVEFSHFIAVLPRTPSGKLSPEARLQEMIGRLHTVATPPPASRTPRQYTTVAYIQFGSGYFGTQPQVANIEQCCATGFAGSVHLERSDLKVRVIDFPPSVNSAWLAGRVIDELSTPEVYTTVGYDSELTRRVPRPCVQQPVSYRSRAITWSDDDVILVTGGAKGITAECAFALARTTGVRMALVGSSPYPQEGPQSGGSAEIARTIERFSSSKLTCKYYQCDISDANAVALLLQRIRQELGEITGVIHGAGLNKPRRVDQVSVEAAQGEITPKVLGAINLCHALQDKPLKLFVGFSSIISFIGMPGNAWYGFSNEALDLILRRFEAEHPETSVLSIGFSVWEEVGMGARMGSIHTLAKMGLEAVSLEEGVGRFLKLIESDPGAGQVLVASRLRLDTWRPQPFSLPAGSGFLEQILFVEPGVEVISRVHLNLERDSYVQDHIYNGSYLFPTVFGLEAMAQAVAYATGESNFHSLRIEDVRLERPIVVDPEKGVDIEIRVEVLERESEDSMRTVQAGIRTEQTGFAMDHFSAIFVLDIESVPSRETIETLETPLDIQPQQDLYSWLLFQGPRFQRLQKVYTLNSQKCVFQTQRRLYFPSDKEGFYDRAEGPFLLGDPFFRDSLLQAGQLVIPQDICLPIHIDSIEIHQPNSAVSGSFIGVTILQGREAKQYKSTTFALDEDGRVLDRLNGYQLRILEHREKNPTAQELAEPSQRDEGLLLRELSNRAHDFDVAVPELSIVYLPDLHALSVAERHQQELPVFHKTVGKLLDAELLQQVQIKWSEVGKPVVDGLAGEKVEVSLSHDERVCLCVAGRGTQGCDIELVTHRTRQDWTALLSDSREPLMQQLLDGKDSMDRAGTRIWTAVEALRKATNTMDIELAIDRKEGDSVLFREAASSSQLKVLTFPVTLTRGPERMIALVVQAIKPA